MVQKGLESQTQKPLPVVGRGRELVKVHMIRWRRSNPQGKWKEIFLEMDALGSALKEKTHTWNKSCRESAKRETELYKMIEIDTKDEKQEDTERNIIKKTLRQLRTEEDEADEVRTLLDDMQQNVDEAEAKVTGTRRRLYREIKEHMHS